jgi:hypothetical protein
MKCSILYKGDELRLTVIRVGIALNVGLDISFDKIRDAKGICDRAGGINSANHETSR